ncbi:MAG: hypothetical protein KF887_10845 [Paracoccaceae bacterium]|nr:MAG: hypothetical protein KF887_10845 [Paracoccaceae bacterium]
MRRVVAPVIAALLAMPGPATADLRDEVTALIRAGDLPAVRAALAVEGAADSRRAFAAFDTAHPAAGRISAALLAETPDDPAAQVARGWYLHATGWAMRGLDVAETIHPEAGRQLALRHGEALELARSAVAAAPGLLPASDLLMASALTTGQHRESLREFARIMDLHPTRRSLMHAARAMSPAWSGGPEDWPVTACTAHAARIADVPDYSPEVCVVDLVFGAGYHGPLRDAAAQSLQGLAHPVLDHARRAHAQEYAFHDPQAAIAVLETLAERGPLDLESAAMLDQLRWQPGDPSPGPVTRLSLSTELPRLREAVDFHPGSVTLVVQLADALFAAAEANGTVADPREIDAIFSTLFDLAPYDGQTWSRYGHMMQRTLDFGTVTLDEIERIRNHFVNGVVLTNHGFDALRSLEGYNRHVWDVLDRRNIDAVDRTGTTAFAKADFDRAVVCPTVRVIRVMQEACSQRRRAGCPQPGVPSPWQPLLDRATAREACAWERRALVRRLAYTAVDDPAPAGD